MITGININMMNPISPGRTKQIPVNVSFRFIQCLLFVIVKMTNSRIIFVFFTLNCTIKKVKLTFFLGNEISTLPYEFHFMPLTFLSNILYYVYTLQKIEVIIWKNIQFCQKRFFYFCIYLCCNYFFGSFMFFSCMPGIWTFWTKSGYCGNTWLRLQYVRRTGSPRAGYF